MGDNRSTSLLRTRSGTARVTNVELFFDLVYVFAVTQLSHRLLDHQSFAGARQTALLLAMVWLVWVYTTWVTNWLDPDRLPVRLMLVSAMLVSLVMSAALPVAFGGRGAWVGFAYAVMQIGRSAFAVVALRGERLQRNFQRILCWCIASGVFAVLGGLEHGSARDGLWAAAVGIDLLGGAVGFSTPRLGRSTTGEWTIEGSHFAERCQAFLLIVLGESIIVIGATFSGLRRVTGGSIGAFAVAFVGAVALWWIYFDRSAEEGAHIVARSKDPGRLGRSAYHFIHPIMVAGIIVTAAADQKVLLRPLAMTGAATAWMILGGTALFLAGHSLFKATVWRVVPRNRLIAIAGLGLLALIAAHVPSLALAGSATAVVVAVAVTDRGHPGRASSHQFREASPSE